MLGFGAISELALGELPGDTSSIPAVEGVGAATLDLSAAAAGVHGVRGEAVASLDITAAVEAKQGVAGFGTAALGLTAGAQGAHGVAAAGAATVSLAAAADALHLRYHLAGEVRDAGVLVNRRVRAYLRSTGALVAEADTVAGKFDIHAGFAAVEFYTVAIDLDEDATDWRPPIANRVMSELVQDA